MASQVGHREQVEARRHAVRVGVRSAATNNGATVGTLTCSSSAACSEPRAPCIAANDVGKLTVMPLTVTVPAVPVDAVVTWNANSVGPVWPPGVRSVDVTDDEAPAGSVTVGRALNSAALPTRRCRAQCDTGPTDYAASERPRGAFSNGDRADGLVDNFATGGGDVELQGRARRVGRHRHRVDVDVGVRRTGGTGHRRPPTQRVVGHSCALESQTSA